MPVAMDLYTWVAAAPRPDPRVHVYSQNVGEHAEMDLQNPNLRLQGHWSAYVLGVAASLRMSGAEIGGANLLVEGKVPMGAGLSSSASVEVAAGYALLESSGLSRSPVELAKICQRAENEFAGARCGIMDQMIACCGRANYALILDCRTLGFRLLPLFPDAQFVVCNSMVKHDHAAGEYNARRADCETATRILAQQLPGVRALRDVSLADLERFAKLLPDVVYRRSRHVISENARVLDARAALERGDPESFRPADARIASQPERRLRSEQRGAGLAGGNCRRDRGRARLAHDGWRIWRLHHQPGAQRDGRRISERRRARLQTSDRPPAGHLYRPRLRRRPRSAGIGNLGSNRHAAFFTALSSRIICFAFRNAVCLGEFMDRRDFMKTATTLLASAALRRSDFAQQAPGSETSVRLVLPMNRGWRYSASFVAGGHDLNFDDSKFARVVVPHTNVALPWHGFDDKTYEFVSLYRRRFQLPPAARGQRVFVDFEGVMTASTVWINGQRLGEYKGGYTPFSFELTPHLNFEGDNLLAVDVDSSERPDIPPFGNRIDYLTFGGIYREVALRIVPAICIENIFAQPKNVLSEHPSLDVHCFVQRLGAYAARSLTLEAVLLDGANTIAKTTQPVPSSSATSEPVSYTLVFAPLSNVSTLGHRESASLLRASAFARGRSCA